MDYLELMKASSVKTTLDSLRELSEISPGLDGGQFQAAFLTAESYLTDFSSSLAEDLEGEAKSELYIIAAKADLFRIHALEDAPTKEHGFTLRWQRNRDR